MKTFLLRLRYYFEILAVPAFFFLVVHLAGHGTMFFLEGSHPYNQIADSRYQISGELVWGLILTFLFVWIWHRPSFKKWVPCSHDHCHTELPIPHLLATVALCLHFFPEAAVRHELLRSAMEGGYLQTLALLGFVAHALVDLIIAFILSSYWKTRLGFWISFIIIIALWIITLLGSAFISYNFAPGAEGAIYLLSAFLLSMFIHKPHKGVVCRECK